MGFPELPAGKILIGTNNPKTPKPAYLQEGAGILIKSASGSITISSTITSSEKTFEWITVSSERFSLQVNKGHLLEWNGTVILSIPPSADIGDEIKILSKTSTWEILPKHNQEIILSNFIINEHEKIFTTNKLSSVHLICVSLPATYMISTFMGSITKTIKNMEKTTQDSDHEDPKLKLQQVMSSVTVDGEDGFVSYIKKQEQFVSRTLEAASEKITIKNKDGIGGNPTIDVDPTKIDKNTLGGEKPLNIEKGGTGKEKFSKNSILLGNGTSEISELTSTKQGDVLISTVSGPAFAELKGEGLDIETKSSQISLKIKSLTLTTEKGLSISDKDKKNWVNTKDMKVGEGIVLKAEPITLNTEGGLWIKDKQKSSEEQSQPVNLSSTITLIAKPITLKTTGGLYILENEKKKQSKDIELSKEVTLTAEKITINAGEGLEGGGEIPLGGQITLSSKGLKWVIATSEQKMKANSGYIVNFIDKTVQLTLPESPKVGDTIKIVGNGSLEYTFKEVDKEIIFAWQIILSDKETIYHARMYAKTIGSEKGYLAAKHATDSITILCIKADAKAIEWIAVDSIGSFETKPGKTPRI